MAAIDPQEPLAVKLRCKSWAQLQHLYERDIKQSKLFLKASKIPPLGTRFSINLLLPSDSTVTLIGSVSEQIPEGGLGGRGPGVLLRLDTVSTPDTWLIESSLKTARAKGSLPASSGAEEASLGEGREIAGAEDELVGSLSKELEQLRKMNPFQLLELDYDCKDGDVRRAFAVLTKRYHPDRFARYQSERARMIGSEIYLLLRDAYAALSSPRARTATLAKVRNQDSATPPPVPPSATATRREQPVAAPGGSGAATPPAEPEPPKSSKSTQKLAKLIEHNKLDEALALAKLHAKKDGSNREARAAVELCEGLKALAQGDRMEAAERLEATLELDPDNEHAVRGLAEIRRRATEERKGFLNKLLKKD